MLAPSQTSEVGEDTAGSEAEEAGADAFLRRRRVRRESEASLPGFEEAASLEPDEAGVGGLFRDLTADLSGPPHVYLTQEVSRPAVSAAMGAGIRNDRGTLLPRLPLTDLDLRLIGLHVARALAAIHARGMAHLDVKPANILVSYGPGGLTCDQDGQWRPFVALLTGALVTDVLGFPSEFAAVREEGDEERGEDEEGVEPSDRPLDGDGDGDEGGSSKRALAHPIGTHPDEENEEDEEEGTVRGPARPRPLLLLPPAPLPPGASSSSSSSPPPSTALATQTLVRPETEPCQSSRTRSPADSITRSPVTPFPWGRSRASPGPAAPTAAATVAQLPEPGSLPLPVFKLADFGQVASLSAADFDEGDGRYLCYEVMNGRTEFLPCGDVFALGMSLLELATGDPLPKQGDPYHAIRRGDFPDDWLAQCSPAMVAAIRGMIHPNPALRPSAADVLRHPLFANAESDAAAFVERAKRLWAAAGGHAARFVRAVGCPWHPRGYSVFDVKGENERRG